MDYSGSDWDRCCRCAHVEGVGSGGTRGNDSLLQGLHQSSVPIRNRHTQASKIYIPHESKKNGSVSFTTGKRRKFCMYTTWLAMLRSDRESGKRSITQRRVCSPMTVYISCVRTFLAKTVCSSTSSER